MSSSPVPVCFSAHGEGIVFSVKAQPGSRKNGFQGMVGDAAKLAVSAPPEDGRANEGLVELIADLLEVRRSQVELLQGKSSRQKRFLVRNLDLETVGKLWNRKFPSGT